MRPLQALAAQRGRLFAWVPVALSLGIGAYFALPVEPDAVALALCALAGACLAALGSRLGAGAAPLALLGALVLAGLCLAALRTHLMTAPVLGHRVYGAVEGRIVAIDRAQSDVPRLVLDRVWLEGVAPEDTPARVRVSLHGGQGFARAEPGLRVALTANLSPPAGPAEPGGFDFRRRAWFDRLGAVGYARSPAVATAPAAEGRAGLVVHRARMGLSWALQARVPGDAGAFAAAILTGDRSAMPRARLQELRDSNLAHLLAISGLHMGLLTGFVFAALRYGLALIPPLALRLPVKKIAAAVALIAAAVYLGLSGGNVATRRAFVMVAVMLAAVLADRRAVTLRSVALAATIVLALEPESLTEPGFQMSFAASTALVAAFGGLRARPEGRRRVPRTLRPVLAVVLSSAVAGAATAPVAAAHFNQVAQFGLLANLLTVPLMGAVVIPAAVIAGVLAPFGLAWIGLAAMRLGILWILGVAHWVAGLEGAVWPVPTPAPAVLPLLALGMLWLILWRGRARWAGLAPVLVAAGLWQQTERPALLISASGRLAGVTTPQGRALNKPRGEGFVAESWLENDGDRATQQVAAARGGFSGGAGALRVDLGGAVFVFLSGRGWEGVLEGACAPPAWLVVPHRLDHPPAGACRLIDAAYLRQSGAIAVYRGAEGPRLVTAAARSGRRPWSQ
ncbi:ComEC/Rec2 family competence protein [Actibacterium sp. MT2.3-13A]|uniref:ComEC/Rec2 family competence protein n=1 Tax=Actibacterium sp. MT2.3-13A TaxID=2828332 RepID=UPI001BA444E3|nr:ComEC/Rec2 family competence protein [Actibacterium sp. MT2.3-13A]